MYNSTDKKPERERIMSRTSIVILIFTIIFAVAGVLFFFLRGYATGYEGVVTAEGEPLENVSVSDGRHVVKTDENGKFKLKGYHNTRFITVTTPAGYTTENYYISADKHKKTGYDFDLQKSSIAAGEAHRFLQISDTEIGEKGVGEWKNYIKNVIDEEHPAFLIHTGDICYEAGLKKHIEDMNTENMGVPVRYVIGNHDYVKGKYGEELFESIYGPVWYSFEVGNVHYVVTSFQNGSDYKSRYSADDRWRWLENDLANTDENMKVVMFNHNRPVSEDYVISFDRKELDLKEHNLIAWVFGHYHYNYVKETDDVLAISTARPDCGGIDSSVSGARMVNIAEDGTVTTKMTYYKVNGKAPAIDGSVWSTNINGNPLFCNTVKYGDKIYIATADEDYPRTCGVTCLDAQSGKELWFYETANSVKNNVVVENGYVYTQDCDGTVYCLNAEDGSLEWKTAVSLGNALSTSSGVCLADGTVYAGCAAAITALNAESGEKIWENKRNYGESSPAEFVVAGGKLLVSSHWDALLALDRKNGKQLWENKDGDIRFRSSTPVVIDENTAAVADSGAIMIVDLSSGKITSKVTCDGYNFSSSAQPLVIGKKLIIPTANKGVVCFDTETSAITWTLETGSALIYTAPYTNGTAQTVEASPVLTEDGNILIASSSGKIFVVTPNGDTLKTIDTGAPIFGSPAIDNGKIYVSDFSGRVSCIAY